MIIRVFNSQAEHIPQWICDQASEWVESEIVRYSENAKPSNVVDLKFSMISDLAKVREMLAKLILRPVEIDLRPQGGPLLKIADIMDLDRAIEAMERMQRSSGIMPTRGVTSWKGKSARERGAKSSRKEGYHVNQIFEMACL